MRANIKKKSLRGTDFNAGGEGMGCVNLHLILKKNWAELGNSS